jgi:acetoacetyl-CoA reductase
MSPTTQPLAAACIHSVHCRYNIVPHEEMHMVRLALVTGGTRGIGAAISMALQDQGYAVAAVYADNDTAAHRFRAQTGIPIYRWDVSDFKACAAGVQQIQEQRGPIDVLVNNAGITRDTILHKMTLEQWRRVIDTNLNSIFNMCRPVIGPMRERGFGRIVNISSINAQKGQLGQANYAAAKAGEIGFSKALALENANKGITVNVICPGLYRHRHGQCHAVRISSRPRSFHRFRSAA